MPDTVKRILIVDDDIPYLETMALEFDERGYQVLTATNHAEALAHIPVCPMFAVIDVQLRPDRGLHVLRDLMSELPDLIAVMLTSDTSLEIVINAMKLGARNYLTKPSKIEDIENALFITAADPDAEGGDGPVHSLEQHEQEYIESVLNACNGNISEAARRLGIHRQSLQRKIKRFRKKS